MNDLFNGAVEMLTKVTEVIKDQLLKIQQLFFSTTPADVTVKRLNDYDEIVEEQIPNLAKIRQEVYADLKKCFRGKSTGVLGEVYTNSTFLSAANILEAKIYSIDSRINPAAITVSTESAPIDVTGYMPVIPSPLVNTESVYNWLCPLKKLKGIIFHPASGEHETTFEINLISRNVESDVAYSDHGDMTNYVTQIMVVKANTDYGIQYGIFIKPLSAWSGFYCEMFY